MMLRFTKYGYPIKIIQNKSPSRDIIYMQNINAFFYTLI